jgi:hypothetical protein
MTTYSLSTAAEDYNGWTNRETWATALHFDNDEGTYRIRLDLMAQAREMAEERDTEILTEEQSTRFYLADLLKDFVEDEAERVTHDPENASEWGRMMLSDVGSVWRVEWDEIARNYLSEG